MRVLIVEDEPLLGDALQKGLQQNGYSTDWVQKGTDADTALRTGQYAVVVLDLGLPGMTGLEVLKRHRRRKADIPVLILTAYDSIEERVIGLDAGADDYLAKPFDMSELAARLRALIRRSAGLASPLLEAGDIRLDPSRHSVSYRDSKVALSAREFALLHALMLIPGKVLSRASLEEELYSWGQEVESNAIEVHIHNLRRKLSPDAITTIRGVGYVVSDKKE